MVEGTVRAVGLARLADAAPVEDQKMREESPVPLRHDLDEVTFYLLWVVLVTQAETVGEASDVCIYDHAFVYAESIAQDYVRGLTSYAR